VIHIIGDIPKRVAVAVSGGADSMAVLDFLRRGNRDIIVLHFNHGTCHSTKAEFVVEQYCETHNIPLLVGVNKEQVPSGVSAEAWWREKRYAWFEKATTLPIIMAHHLDDVVENWIFTSMNGNPFLIPYHRDQYLRPFLTTRKSDLKSWCKRKSVCYIEDPSNQNINFKRNYIRHSLMPHALEINPGIHKTIKKKVLDSHWGYVVS